MNAKRICKIIRETLKASKNKVLRPEEFMIGLAFYHKTKLFDSDPGNKTTVGMLDIPYEDAEWFIRSTMRPSTEIYQDVANVCLIDLRNDDMKDIMVAMDYNIAFQILFTYYYMMDRLNNSPPDDAEEAIYLYHRHMDNDSSINAIKKSAAEYSKLSEFYKE